MDTPQNITSKKASGITGVMDPSDNVPEAGNTGTIKHEVSESDTKLASGDDRADPVPQPVKRENGTSSCDGFTSAGPLPGDSLLGLSARVKVEVGENITDMLHTSIEIKEEDSWQSDQWHGDAWNRKTSNEPHIERAVFPTKGTKIRNKLVRRTQHPVSSTRKNLPKKRIRTLNGEKPFRCSHCSSSFSRKDSLKLHIRTHTGEKPYSCSHCSSSFSRKNNLTEHIRTHTGEKPFSCSHCSSSFSRKNNLTEHIRTHTGEKPFSCNHCSSSFIQKSDLTVHIRTHTGEKPFICSHCSSSFNGKTALKRHILTHTGEKPFSCSHCSPLLSKKNI